MALVKANMTSILQCKKTYFFDIFFSILKGFFWSFCNFGSILVQELNSFKQFYLQKRKRKYFLTPLGTSIKLNYCSLTALNFLPWDFVIVKKLEIEKTKIFFIISVLKVVYHVVLFFSIFNFFVNKNSQGTKLSGEKIPSSGNSVLVEWMVFESIRPLFTGKSLSEDLLFCRIWREHVVYKFFSEC